MKRIKLQESDLSKQAILIVEVMKNYLESDDFLDFLDKLPSSVSNRLIKSDVKNADIMKLSTEVAKQLSNSGVFDSLVRAFAITFVKDE